MNQMEPAPGMIVVQSESLHQQQSVGNGEMLMRPPVWFRALGSASVLQLRYLYWLFMEKLNGLPHHVSLFGADTTYQTQDHRVGMLPDEMFMNLADEEGMQRWVRLAYQIPRIAEWLPEKVTQLAVGDGAGSIPSAARLIYEKVLPRVGKKLCAIAERFKGANRAELASQSNQSPWMRDNHMAVTAEGPIEVVYAISAAGGTTAVQRNDLMYMRLILRQLGIEAKFTMVMTLPALSNHEVIDVKRKLENLYGRFQELSDDNSGRIVVWRPTDSAMITDKGPFFHTIYLMPEPREGNLDAHHHLVGQFLFQMVMPLGKSLSDRAVDKLPIFRDHGTLRQPKFLSTANMAVLKATAFPDAVGFACAHLSRSVSTTDIGQPQADSEAGTLLEKHRLTFTYLKSVEPRLSPPQISSGVGAGNTKTYLDNVEKNLASQGLQKAKEAANTFGGLCSTFRKDLAKLQQAACRTHGLDGAKLISQEVCKRLHSLVADAKSLRSDLATRSENASDESTDAKLKALTETRQYRAQSRYYADVTEHLETVAEAADTLDRSLDAIVGVFRELAIACDQQRLTFDEKRAERHALLDAAALLQCAEAAMPACMQEVRECAAQAVGSEIVPSRLKAVVQVIIERHAEPFRQWLDFDEAFKAAGPRAEQAIKNVLIAAKPDVRLEPFWEPRRECSQIIFVTLPEKHPAMAYIRATGRVVCCAPTDGSRYEIVILAVDYGIEMGALTATHEAVKAHLTGNKDFPPFPDKTYLPVTDVVVPRPDEWFGYLTIPLHLFLSTGVVRQDWLDGWSYNDMPLGHTRMDASERIRDSASRPPGFPSVQEISRQTEILLRSGRTPEQIIAILNAMEKTLSQQIQETSQAEKQILMRERAATRAILDQYCQRLQAIRAHEKFWPANRILPDGIQKDFRRFGNGEAKQSDGNASPDQTRQPSPTDDGNPGNDEPH